MKHVYSMLYFTHNVLLCGNRAALRRGLLATVKQRADLIVPVWPLTVTVKLPSILLLRVIEHGTGGLVGTHHAVSSPFVLLQHRKYVLEGGSFLFRPKIYIYVNKHYMQKTIIIIIYKILIYKNLYFHFVYFIL